jgi:hypothetical protein
VAAAFMIGVKPANALFLAGVVLAFTAARRWRQALVFGAAMAPGLLALALWKYKGLGSLPILPARAAGTASIAPPGSAALHLPHYVRLNWHQFGHNLDGLREFFWSVRVVEWFSVAGFAGLLRQAPAKALLVGGWFGAFLLVKGTSPGTDVEAGTFLRLFMPALPALLLLVAGVLLLVPMYASALARRFPPAATHPLGARSRPLAGSVALLGVLPAILFAALPSLQEGQAAKYFTNNTYTPVTNGQLRLRAVRRADGVHVSWTAPPSTAKVFYRVFRAPHHYVYASKLPPWIDGLDCLSPNGGAADCSIQMDVLTTTRAHSFVDSARLKPQEYAYRVGVMANWADDPSGGDVLFVSRPFVIAAA